MLGTVQFGLNYGINNSNGKPDQNEINRILDLAKSANILQLDTAISYGDSLTSLAQYPNIKKFSVSSKYSLEKKSDFGPLEQVQHTLSTISKDSLYIYYFHHFPDIHDKDLFKSFIQLKNKGLIENIGVSIYDNSELREAIKITEIDFIQLPYNIFDSCSEKIDLMRHAKSNNKTLIGRSSFLQGLFFKDPSSLPASLESLINPLERLHAIAKSTKISVTHLALGYSLSQDLLDFSLIGVDTREQLEQNLLTVSKTLSSSIIDELNSIEIENRSLLNPSNWK